jgi:magnesium transporter
MTLAMILNLLVARDRRDGACPCCLERLNRDPALGSSVLLTFTTDSMGFFIFLGLASIFFR